MKKYRKGFTLVEMMVVISLLAILVTMIVRDAQKQRIKARDNVRVAEIDIIRLSLEEYKLACGEYPKSINLTTDNGCDIRGNGKTLADFLPQIPIGIDRATPSLIDAANLDGGKNIAGSFNYYYTGLSTASGASAKCYDYRIAAELEIAEANGQDRSKFLDKDSDSLKNTNPYKYPCRGTTGDFGSNNASNDDDLGLYDFRSNSF